MGRAAGELDMGRKQRALSAGHRTWDGTVRDRDRDRGGL